MLTDGWKYIVRAYRPLSAGGGLEWAEGFGNGGARDAKLLAAAMDIRAGKLGMVAVESHVAPWRRKQAFESAAQVQAWVNRMGQVLR